MKPTDLPGHPLALAVIVTVLSVSTAIAAVPLRVPVQGALRDNAGQLVLEGGFAATFSVYTSPSDGVAVWTETWPPDGGDCQADSTGCLLVGAGRFRIDLGTHTPLDPGLFVAGDLWLGVAIEGEPELPRRPLGSAPYALHAGSAANLSCTACVPIDALSGTARAALVDEALLAAAAAGFQQGPQDVTEESLPAGGLNEVSNGTLSNEHTEVFASSGPTPIPDYFPPGVASEIVLPSLGLARALRVQVELHNSDLSTVQVLLHDPMGESYLLWDGNAEGDHILLDFPPEVPLSGDLTTWEGMDPQGAWLLEVIDDGFFNDADDGQVDAWSIEVDLLSDHRVRLTGMLRVDGEVAATGSVVVGDSGIVCDASRAGALHFDATSRHLFLCDGVELLRVQACSDACLSPEELACGEPVTDGCGALCEGTGTALNTVQCLTTVGSTICGAPVEDGCGNACGLSGTALDLGGCPAPETVSCGTSVVDGCNNVCGTAGSLCAGSSECLDGVCVTLGETPTYPAGSCQAILDADADAASGEYWISHNGAATLFTCDMQDNGVAWLRVHLDDFESGASGWSMNSTSSCGALTTILGGFNVLSGGDVHKTFYLDDFDHDEVRLTMQFIELDTADGEEGRVSFNGSKIFSESLSPCVGTDYCGLDCGDTVYEIDNAQSHNQNTVTVSFGSSLNQGPDDEAIGADNVAIWVR